MINRINKIYTQKKKKKKKKHIFFEHFQGKKK